MGENEHLRLHSVWPEVAFAVAWLGALSIYWIHIKDECAVSGSSEVGNRARLSGLIALRSRNLHRRHCCDSLGGTRHLSRHNSEPQAKKTPAWAVAHLACDCPISLRRNVPQGTSPPNCRGVHDNMVAIVVGFVVVDASGSARAPAECLKRPAALTEWCPWPNN